MSWNNVTIPATAAYPVTIGECNAQEGPMWYATPTTGQTPSLRCASSIVQLPSGLVREAGQMPAHARGQSDSCFFSVAQARRLPPAPL